jgi:methionyl-tRNA formyltransferase
MKVIILTSSYYGTAAHHLPFLIKNGDCEISMVVLSVGTNFNKKKSYKRKLLKILNIGILGALNGIRMRKWYTVNVRKYVPIKNLELICKENSIPFFVTPTINCDTTFRLFQQAQADVGISLGNGYIGKRIFSTPFSGMINIHHEILPQYQNAQSVIWQIYNCSSFTGYTIHKINEHIDKGEIIFQERVPITFKETLSETVSATSALLLESSAKGLIYLLSNFKGLMDTSISQGTGKHYTTPSIWQYFKIVYNFNRLKKSSTKFSSGS